MIINNIQLQVEKNKMVGFSGRDYIFTLVRSKNPQNQR